MFSTAANLDGVLQLDTVEKEIVHERVTCDTRDHEDHTFCGVMFDIACETRLPAKYIEIESLSVRGELGPMTVWRTNDTYWGKHESPECWNKVYEGQHPPSHETYTELKLEAPIRLRPGESCGLYVHSALPGDAGIVYDNQRQRTTCAQSPRPRPPRLRAASRPLPHPVADPPPHPHPPKRPPPPAARAVQDKVIRLNPGMAHLSNRPFGKRGFWGRPWRNNREFVGKVLYGVRWRMWNPSPETMAAFPLGFQRAVLTMMCASRRPESLMYLLQDEIVMFIMNKCSWNWWGDEMAANPDEASSPDEREAGSLSRTSAGAALRSFGSSFAHHFAGSSTHSSLYDSLLGAGHMGQLLEATMAQSTSASALSALWAGEGWDESDGEDYEEEEEEEGVDWSSESDAPFNNAGGDGEEGEEAGVSAGGDEAGGEGEHQVNGGADDAVSVTERSSCVAVEALHV